MPCQKAELLPQHRHNLPQWLAEALQAQLGGAGLMLWPPACCARHRWICASIPLNAKREAVKCRGAGHCRRDCYRIGSEAYSPWGLRVRGRTGSGQAGGLCARRAVEVQDEGSQLLALLLDAKRGEMVVDFRAGAGGKALADWGATMRGARASVRL